MTQYRAVCTGRPVGRELLFRIEQLGFWGWKDVGYVWATSPQEALKIGVAECER